MPDYKPTYENSYALVIGIDAYAAINPLYNAVRDAEAVAQTLDGMGFEVRTLFDDEATRSAIYGAAHGWLGHAGPDDRVIIYFAGHGDTNATRRGTREEKVGYLLPHNVRPGQYYDAINMQNFVTHCDQYIPAKHILFLLDACFSASVFRTRSAREDDVKDTLVTAYRAKPAIQAIVAGQADEQVADSGPGGHSPFTGYLLDHLQRTTDLLTAKRLGIRLEADVNRQTSGRQTPHSGSLVPGQTGDFVFWEAGQAPTDGLPPDLLEALNSGSRYAFNGALGELQALAAGDNLRATLATEELRRMSTDENRPYWQVTAARDALDALTPHPLPPSVDVLAEPELPKQVERLAAEPEETTIDVTVDVPAQQELQGRPSDHGHTNVHDILPPPFEWCEIPAGRVTIAKQAFNVQPFWMAKYPVTYAQYQVFVEADDGFTDDRWWEGLAADADHRAQPGGQRWKIDTHPRENVSWWDSVAFCRWLSHRTGLEIRLPTEWEWQWAAQGDTGWDYPWGDDYIQGYANIDEKNSGVEGGVYLEKTSPVGSYPQGASPFGVLDMSGNVWEWCLNEYDSPENTALSGYRRVVRGGSWLDTSDFARASYRFRYNPNNRNYNLGFRVCVSVPIK